MATKAPTGTEIPRVLIVVVVGLIVIIAVFAIFPFLQQAFTPRPTVSLSNLTETRAGCGTGNGPSNYYTYTFDFVLTNNGNTNANVTVSILQSTPYSFAVAFKSFIIPKASQASETMSLSLPNQDCHIVDLTVEITSTATA